MVGEWKMGDVWMRVSDNARVKLWRDMGAILMVASYYLIVRTKLARSSTSSVAMTVE